MHTHRVNRMAGDSNGRTHIFRRNLLIDGIVRRVVFTHGVPPIRPVTNRGVRVFPLLIAMALAGCGGDLSTLDPVGPAARDVARLWWAMLAGSTVLFALVMALFTLVMLKPEAGCRWTPRSWIVGGGIVMPVPILAVLLIFAFAQGERHLPWRGEHNPVRIEARAHMWFWEFHYLDYPEAEPTIGVMHMPAWYEVDVIATSNNVIHGFWVPRLGGKVDAIPGHETVVRLFADDPGTFGGICVEYCGRGHASMTFRAEAHTPADFYAAIGVSGEGRK